MEATLPKFAAVDSPAKRIAPAPPPFGATAPSVALPLMFMLTGLLALFLAAGWLVAQPALLATYHYNQSVIALTHLFVLGWICSIVMGAMYQLVPIALETRLHSERLARWHFALHVTGFIGMVWMFRVWNLQQVGHFGCVLVAGVALFVYNLVQTLRRVPKWNVTATAVSAALGWISCAVLAGLSIAAAKCSYEAADRLPPAGAVGALLAGLRAVAGYVSRFLPIVGVYYTVIPMFTLSEIQNPRRAAASVALLNAGLLGSFVTILLRSPWKIFFALAVVLALAVYGREMRAILRARKRAPLDWGLRYFLTAIGLLAPLSVLAVGLAWPGLPLNGFTGQLENVYGFLGFAGVVTLAIIGMLYKIIPFLVWFHTYGPHVGRAQLPALADMYSPRLQALGYWTFLGGLAATCAATALASERGVRAGCVLFALGLVPLALNIGNLLHHFFRPQLTPLAAPKGIST
ncbi:MAG: cbb3-type cytochrome c oxidase subunit I [Verrucomicrobia bacterium]|nr:cbb3-type cytochrome c oxidase subunit I [Verrucomicrobiota bacterium]